ncbi:type IV secretory system conjugative DNA transfer family protein [Leisingera aquaemixtae]|uniref:Conjugal transfer coupling protein TraG n=1 Tax=Leisingera aquaemixtae TaxID=1396826 RepID=A0A0P1HE03_9RHOB|nr:TraM recognition domain-containing protein [Leisingera aquaemixtae]CUI01868.1 conjugal transfer coupling protein TraG [Leisingera aquaemixtae]
MSFPFGWVSNWKRRKPLPFAKPKPVDPKGQRLLGFTLDTHEPLWAPKGHSLLLAANGGGKTTCGAMPWLYSFAASERDKAVLCLDSKNGEMAIQAAEMLARTGRKVAIIDDMGVWTDLEAYRVSLNPFGAAVATFQRDPRDMVYTSENITHAAIKEPPGGEDAKNLYFRAWPRNVIEFCILVYAKRDVRLLIPGGVSQLLSRPDTLLQFAAIEAEEGDAYLKGLAQSIVAMSRHEHWPQHLEEAQRALRIFAPGTRLHHAGKDATISHEQLIREGYVIFLVGPQSVMNRMGVFYALHMLAFAEALYYGAGTLRIIADEFTNCPLSSLVEMLTTLRAFGGTEVHMIAQSRSEIERRFGKRESETIAENAVVQIWYGFSAAKEARLVSEMMGEEHALATSLGSNEELKLNTNISLTRQKHMTPAELLAMRPDLQLIYVKGIGFILARKVGMQNIAPFCHRVAPNKIEGGTLRADPRITFVTPMMEAA